jgi:hypothetical protein
MFDSARKYHISTGSHNSSELCDIAFPNTHTNALIFDFGMSQALRGFTVSDAVSLGLIHPCESVKSKESKG